METAKTEKESPDKISKTLDVFDKYMQMKMKHHEKARKMLQKAAKDEINFVKEIKGIFEEKEKLNKSKEDRGSSDKSNN